MATIIDRTRAAFERMWKKPDAELLKGEIAGAELASTRSISGGHPANGLTPEGLAQLLRSAEDGEADAYLDLAEQMEERDLHYLSVMGTRKRQVAQLPITVDAATDEAGDQRVVDFIREWLTRDDLETEIFDILDGIGKGFSATEIVWDQDGKLWYPEALKYRLPRWFAFDTTTGETPLLKGSYGTEGHNSLRGSPLPPAKFVFHLHPAKSGLPIRNGLARPVAWAYLFKNYAIKDWVAFAEIYGRPFRIGKYPAGATPEQIHTLLRAVAGMGEDAAAVIPDSMMIELVDSKAQGGDLFDRLTAYLDRQISKAVLGQTATTDADTGGLGSGKEHGDVRADIERADAKLLSASIQRDIITPMVRLNFGPDVAIPKLKIGREEDWDAGAMMPAIREFVSMGGRVEISVIRDKLGLPDPPKDAELLTAPAPPAPTILTEPEISPASARKLPKAPEMPEAASTGFLVGSLPSYSAIAARGGMRDFIVAAAARVAAAESDQIDAAADALVAEHGDALLDGLARPLIDAIAAGASFEDVREILDRVAGDMDDAALATMLEKACMISHLAGETGHG